MARKRIHLRNVTFSIYEIETDLETFEEIEKHFFSLDPYERLDALVENETFECAINEIQDMGQTG
ncbi:MAG: hypothetical protein AMJ56_00485 [Anaerolineae bacterium SG8_19]|nr:MAG: hypothetical protein AMJ56_00485 [Anaerolineae bacterium SG8_19]